MTTTANPIAQSALADISQGLGALVWWSLTDTKITPDRMRAILTSEGADASIVPDIDPSSAIKRSTREWSQGRGHADRFRAEVASDSSDLVVGILRREQVNAAEVRWVQVDALTFDHTGSVIDAPFTDEGRSFLGTATDYMNHLDHNWIRPAIIQAGLKDANACSLRDRGGVFYVPRQSGAKLDQLVRIIGQIGACHLDVVTVSATGSSQQAIGRGASASLRDDLGELLTQIAGWKDSARKVASSSGASVLCQLVELRQRADLYADALSISLDDLTDAVDEARAEAERLLADDDTASIPFRKPRDGIVEALRLAIESAIQEGAGVLIPASVATANGLPTSTYQFWSSGVGAASAATLGYAASLRTDGGAPARGGTAIGIVLRSTGKVETTETKPAQEPTKVEAPVIELERVAEPEQDDGEDTAAAMRERLAEKTAMEVYAIYTKATGKVGRPSKAHMIQAIIEQTL